MVSVGAQAAIETTVATDTCPANVEVCVIPIYILPADNIKHHVCYSEVRYERTIVPAGVKRVIWALVDGRADKTVYNFVEDSREKKAIHLLSPDNFDNIGHVGQDRRYYIWDFKDIPQTSSDYQINVKRLPGNGKPGEDCEAGDPTIANFK